jgi:hypothetical protein
VERPPCVPNAGTEKKMGVCEAYHVFPCIGMEGGGGQGWRGQDGDVRLEVQERKGDRIEGGGGWSCRGPNLLLLLLSESIQ